MPRRDAPTRVFISYCHRDTQSLRQLETVLAPVTQGGTLDLWDDRRIGTGAAWQQAIERSLSRAQVAVLLVTSDFLASTFISGMEFPAILQAHKEEGLEIVWVPVGPSLFNRTPLADIQAAIDPCRPLKSMKRADRDTAWVEVAKKILEVAERPFHAPSITRARAPNGTRQSRVPSPMDVASRSVRRAKER